MYITFIRPLLEYASEVWDGCTQSDIEQLEKVQLHAARITGRFVFTIDRKVNTSSFRTHVQWFTTVVFIFIRIFFHHLYSIGK